MWNQEDTLHHVSQKSGTHSMFSCKLSELLHESLHLHTYTHTHIYLYMYTMGLEMFYLGWVIKAGSKVFLIWKLAESWADSPLWAPKGTWTEFQSDKEIAAQKKQVLLEKNILFQKIIFTMCCSGVWLLFHSDTFLCTSKTVLFFYISASLSALHGFRIMLQITFNVPVRKVLPYTELWAMLLKPLTLQRPQFEGTQFNLTDQWANS